MSDESVISSFVEVELVNSEDFLKIKETLSRIGIPSRKTNTLFQTCHILHKKGRYYIVHFLEMFRLDGKESHFSDEDRQRRNRIARSGSQSAPQPTRFPQPHIAPRFHSLMD